MRITRCVLAGGSSNNVEPYRLGQRVAFSCVSARPPGETNSREDEMEIDRCGYGAMNWRQVPDSRPQVPPDSHGDYGRYSDLANERKIRCLHDDDECHFVKLCPNYTPMDYDGGLFELAPEEPKQISATCKLASTGKEFAKAIYGYELSEVGRRYMDYVDESEIPPVFFDAELYCSRVPEVEQLLIFVWGGLKYAWCNNGIELAVMLLKHRIGSLKT
jgi:hypothetical protein